MPINVVGIGEMHAHPCLGFSTIPLNTSRTTYLNNAFEKGMYSIHIFYLRSFSPYENHGIFFPYERNHIKNHLS